MIRLMQEKDCLEVAKIHKVSLQGDFLPELGTDVLKTIYKGLLKDKKSFGYVTEEGGEIAGFITGTEDMGGIFKKIIKNQFIPLSYYLLLAIIKKPYLIMNTIQTFAYNKKSETDTKSELVSIAIKENYRGKKLGKKLVNALVKRMKQRGIKNIKVSVNESNISANKFYKKIGFKYNTTFEIYKKKMNLYTLKT